MADNASANDAAAGELPPAVIEFAGKMYNAARTGDVEVFQQALPAGLPANMRNEKGDTLVGLVSVSLNSDRVTLIDTTQGAPASLSFLELWQSSHSASRLWADSGRSCSLLITAMRRS
jgi:hypothetical protein